MEAERCPICTGSIVIHGCVGAPDAVGVNLCFIPPGAPPLRWNLGVHLPYAFLYCLSCGHLWTRLEPAKVLEFLKGCGTELARQHYESLLAGPYHGLPDYPEAHEAAEKVARIDELMIYGKDGEATRRYRELTGTTWDRSIAVVASWRNLERARKLAMFGWSPKDKSQADSPEESGHPMRDRWLDG